MLVRVNSTRYYLSTTMLLSLIGAVAIATAVHAKDVISPLFLFSSTAQYVRALRRIPAS